DVAELLLIPSIFGGQLGQRRGRSVDGPLLLPVRARGGVATPVADERVGLRRLEPFVVGQGVHGVAGRLEPACCDLAGPPPVRKTLVEPRLEVVTQSPAAPARN